MGINSLFSFIWSQSNILLKNVCTEYAVIWAKGLAFHPHAFAFILFILLLLPWGHLLSFTL